MCKASFESDRGEFAELTVQLTEDNKGCVISLEDASSWFISIILEKKSVRSLRDKLTEMLNHS